MNCNEFKKDILSNSFDKDHNQKDSFNQYLKERCFDNKEISDMDKTFNRLQILDSEKIKISDQCKNTLTQKIQKKLNNNSKNNKQKFYLNKFLFK